MNLGKAIRGERARLELSQEDLAARIYVSRQTVSSWENGKSYPDVYSLVLLSQVFGTSIDDLVKGDVKEMERTIEITDVKAWKRYSIVQWGGLAIAVVMMSIAWIMASTPIFLGAGIALIIATTFGISADKIRKDYNVRTYREILAFTRGETLDEIARLREEGKRPYQATLFFIALTLLWAALSALAGTIILP